MTHVLDPDYFENFILKRAKLDLKIKLLLQDSAHARKYKKKEDKRCKRCPMFDLIEKLARKT